MKLCQHTFVKKSGGENRSKCVRRKSESHPSPMYTFICLFKKKVKSRQLYYELNLEGKWIDLRVWLKTFFIPLVFFELVSLHED